MKRLLLVAVAVATLLTVRTAVAVDATAAWNQYNEQYNFAPYPQSSSATFSDAYLGSDFERDAAGISSAVSASVMSTGREIVGNDLLNQTLLNW